MKAEVTRLGDSNAHVAVSGRVDASTYLDLQAIVDGLAADVNCVTFDFRDVEYISSAGLRVVMAAGKKYGARNVIITNVVPVVFETFHMAGYDGVFEIQEAGEEVASYIRYSYKDLLASKCEKSPDTPILKHLGVTYTWADLEACAQICAYDLFRLGVRKGSHVAICSANSANWIICFFAVQKLGAVACLMNFNYSEQEIVNAAKVGDITHLCVGEANACDDFASFVARINSCDDSPIEQVYDISKGISFKDRLREYASVKGLFDAKVESDDICVMIYTSGSTGVPKGVLLSAYNVLNAADSMAATMGMTSSDRLCLILPLFHIFGLNPCLSSCLLRDSLIIIPDSMKTNVILSTIEENRCTLFHSVPTMVLALMANKDFASSRVSSLRATILAGAAATEAQVMRMGEMFPNNHFICSYGLSEMAPVSMTAIDDTIEHVATTVGKPLGNIRIKVVDTETGADLPAGVSGEIMVEGFNLMTCYYKAAIELQAVDGSGWLQTGDLGFLDEDGYLHLTGRAKELIIRGGENIMPSEVAEAISEFPGVADVKVQGVPDDFYGEVVGASVVMANGEKLDSARLKEFLATRIAKFKIPAFVFQFDAFPLLSNGKVDAITLKKLMNDKVAALRSQSE